MTAEIIQFPERWVSIEPLSPIDLVKAIPGILVAENPKELAELIIKLSEEI